MELSETTALAQLGEGYQWAGLRDILRTRHGRPSASPLTSLERLTDISQDASAYKVRAAAP